MDERIEDLGRAYLTMGGMISQPFDWDGGIVDPVDKKEKKRKKDAIKSELTIDGKNKQPPTATPSNNLQPDPSTVVNMSCGEAVNTKADQFTTNIRNAFDWDSGIKDDLLTNEVSPSDKKRKSKKKKKKNKKKKKINNVDDTKKDETLTELLKNHQYIDQNTYNNLCDEDREDLKHIWNVTNTDADDVLNKKIQLEKKIKLEKRKNRVVKNWKDMSWQEAKKYGVGIFFTVFFSHPGLLLFLIMYTALGTFLFKSIEHTAEEEMLAQFNDFKLVAMDDITKSNTDHQNKLINKKMIFYNLNRIRAFTVNLIDKGRNTKTENKLWGHFGAIFYCITIYTTIGYGSTACITYSGQLATILYALIGIPLFFIVMAYFSKSAKDVLQYAYTRWRKFTRWSRRQHLIISDDHESINMQKKLSKISDVDDEDDEEYPLPPTIASVVLLVYIMMGTFIYTNVESWSVGQSFYFIVISFLAIGFGDIVPDDLEVFVMTGLYLIFGISILSLTVRVFGEYYERKTEQAINTAKQIKDNRKLDKVDVLVKNIQENEPINMIMY